MLLTRTNISFSPIGIGGWFKGIFDKLDRVPLDTFPRTVRGNTLLIVADFSGQGRRSEYDTYSFLLLDIDRHQHWLESQRRFRTIDFAGKRRVAFKNLNDRQRRSAMPQFLALADSLDGELVTIAISRRIGSSFTKDNADAAGSILMAWKPHVRERVLRIVHMSTFLLSGFSQPGQDVLWVIDQDEIASNETQLRQLTEALGRVWTNLDCHMLGHIRCGTTASDEGSFALEDLASIPDLAAGAVTELANSWRDGSVPVSGLIKPVSPSLAAKTRALLEWLSKDDARLQRKTIIVDSGAEVGKVRLRELRLTGQRLSALIIPKFRLLRA